MAAQVQALCSVLESMCTPSRQEEAMQLKMYRYNRQETTTVVSSQALHSLTQDPTVPNAEIIGKLGRIAIAPQVSK